MSYFLEQLLQRKVPQRSTRSSGNSKQARSNRPSSPDYWNDVPLGETVETPLHSSQTLHKVAAEMGKAAGERLAKWAWVEDIIPAAKSIGSAASEGFQAAKPYIGKAIDWAPKAVGLGGMGVSAAAELSGRPYDRQPTMTPLPPKAPAEAAKVEAAKPSSMAQTAAMVGIPSAALLVAGLLNNNKSEEDDDA